LNALASDSSSGQLRIGSALGSSMCGLVVDHAEVQRAWIDHQLALRSQITRDHGS
jgi:hypothetical protein